MTEKGVQKSRENHILCHVWLPRDLHGLLQKSADDELRTLAGEIHKRLRDSFARGKQPE